MRSPIITPKKVRSDAVLKRLPEGKQESIMEYWRTHTSKQTVKWLEDGGITTSIRALSLFRAWHLTRKKYDEREMRILDRVQHYKDRDPSLTNELLTKIGEYLFNEIAIDQEDVKTWSVARQVQLKRESQTTDRKKLGLELKKYKDLSEKAVKVVENNDLTFEEKEAAMKQILGIKS
jgi:hypothetical protein